MNKVNDLTGKVFSMLTAVRLARDDEKPPKGALGTYWVCRCECGQTAVVRTVNLTAKPLSRATKSCGCLRRKGYNKTHGLSLRSEYTILKNIIGKCTDRSNKSYPRFGGIGIKVTKSWLGPNGIVKFLKDVGDRPSMQHVLRRIDENAGFTAKNCFWTLRYTYPYK